MKHVDLPTENRLKEVLSGKYHAGLSFRARKATVRVSPARDVLSAVSTGKTSVALIFRISCSNNLGPLRRKS